MLTYKGVIMLIDQHAADCELHHRRLQQMSLFDDLAAGLAHFSDTLAGFRIHVVNHPAPIAGTDPATVQQAIDTINSMAGTVSDIHKTLADAADAAQAEQTAQDTSAEDLNQAEAAQIGQALTPPQQQQ